MKNYIYKDNLPSFRQYELFDTMEEDYKATMVIPAYKGRGIRGISTLYIKGIERIDDYEDKIEYEKFFNDYLKLGKDLFELSMTEHQVHFIENYELDIPTLISNYIECVFFEIPLSDLQLNIIGSIRDLTEDFIYMELPSKYNVIIWDIIDLIDEIMDILFLLVKEKNYNIDDYLNDVWGILEETIDISDNLNKKGKLDRILEILLDCQMELNKLFEKIEEIIKKGGINLKKKISISNAQKKEIKKNNILNKDKESPLIVLFTCDQLDDLKKLIITFLNKYGFPYYVFTDDEENYKKYVNDKITKIEDNSDIIPCDILILNSIFNYLLCTILKDWKIADDEIKKIWKFDDKKIKSKNVMTIHKIRTMCSYFNNSLSSKLYEFKNHVNSLDDENNFNMVPLDNEDDYNSCDNYLKIIKDDCYYQFLFNNLCIAANEILTKKYRYDKINDKIDKCKNCGKPFIPSKDLKKYCCKECKKERRRKNKTKNRRNERKRKKSM